MRSRGLQRPTDLQTCTRQAIRARPSDSWANVWGQRDGCGLSVSMRTPSTSRPAPSGRAPSNWVAVASTTRTSLTIASLVPGYRYDGNEPHRRRCLIQGGRGTGRRFLPHSRVALRIAGENRDNDRIALHAERRPAGIVAQHLAGDRTRAATVRSGTEHHRLTPHEPRSSRMHLAVPG